VLHAPAADLRARRSSHLHRQEFKALKERRAAFRLTPEGQEWVAKLYRRAAFRATDAGKEWVAHMKQRAAFYETDAGKAFTIFKTNWAAVKKLRRKAAMIRKQRNRPTEAPTERVNAFNAVF
jgi:DNA-binding PadR family transcriptional regulator